MKKTIILVSAFLALTITSCSFLKGSTTNTTAATTTQTVATTTNAQQMGQTAGTALDQLYTTYKATGTIDMSNLQNLINVAQVVNSCQQLKASYKDAEYTKSFSKGLLAGSLNLTTETASQQVTNQLATMMQNVDTDNLNNSFNTAITQAKSTTQTAVSNAATKVNNAAETASNVAGNVQDIATSVTSILSLFGK